MWQSFKWINQLVGYLCISVIVTLLITGCSDKSTSVELEVPGAEFSRYINAFSGGVIPTDEPIRVQLAFAMVDSATVGTEAPDELFRIRPAVKGKVLWHDTRTLEFRPDENLAHDKVFNVTFRLDKLLNVEKQYNEFRFGLRTMPQSVSVQVENVQVYYVDQQAKVSVRGVVETADATNAEQVRQVVELEKGFGDGYEISWSHENRYRKHTFIIDNITRKNSDQELIISWNGKKIGADQKGEQEIVIPAPGKFQLVHTHFEQSSEPTISLQFSEPLSQQNLSGLVFFPDQRNLVTRISNNEILIFADKTLKGQQLLTIEPSLADITGKRLGQKVLREFYFRDIKPAVRLTGRGVILPSSKDLLFPFEAVNLAAVDVKLIRIHEDNILQFLQVNQLDEEDELRRVGRVVAQRTLRLDTGRAVNLNQWNSFAIDLAEAIQPEPGAIYRVYISFKKEYSVYSCDGTTGADASILNTLDTSWETTSDQVRYWGAYDEYDYYDDYEWNQRDNPCHNSYYRNKSVSRNILASNLGILAKKQPDGLYHFAVTDLITTKPVAGVSISLYNYQQQLLETVTTDNDGFASVDARGIPFVAVAAKDTQRAYLRLDDGSSLSVSMFDVDGERLVKGLKGFIYGERGVWRPGDTLFLNFIMEDQHKTLPQGFPVVFQMYNPLGQLVQTAINKDGLNGFYTFKAFTAADAPTGNYTAVFKAGGAEFSRTLKIETVMPNRLRIKVNFENDMLPGYKAGTGNLKAEWLHGGIARSLRAEVTATLNPSRTLFNEYKEYSFDDPTRKFTSETFPVFQGSLDATGEARLSADINLNSQAPGILSAAIETKVFEEGGAFSIDRFVIPFKPFRSYAGVKLPRGSGWGGMLQTDSLYTLQLINVDVDGKIKNNNKLRVDIYKVGWRWWWDASDEYFGEFSAGSYNRPVYTRTVDVASGKASVSFRINYPEWGRYLVLVTDLESGHRSGDFMLIDWPSWRGASREGRQQAAAMLSFKLDKEKYQPGDDMVVTFPSTSGGRALVSIESGSMVLERKWVETKNESTTFKVKIKPEMAPNAYVHITLLQPHANTLNDLPIRLYGVLPFFTEDDNTRLEPVITMPDVLKPEQQVNIKVKEQKGRAMTYTLAMVDEGLLDLTRFKTPDPWNHFYAREALGIKTWDMYDYVMGAFGSEFSRLLGLGGDDFIQPPGENDRANRFKPVVRFFGPFSLERNKEKTHTFTMPQYAGSVRVMVIAGQDAAYGSTEKTVPVRQSLMALATLPRVLGPGEKVRFPVNIFAMDESVKQVQVTVGTNELIKVSGADSQTLTFNTPGDQLAWFDMETPRQEGVARVKVTAKSGSETVTVDVELDVRNANPEVSSAENLMLEGRESKEVEFQLTGMPGTRRVVLELSSIPVINLEQRLKYLIEYPHGCTEQIVSGAFPQLYLDVFTQPDDEQKQRIQANIESVLARLPGRQLTNGGITYWPGSTMANDWITSYTGHFALEAQKKGFVLPSALLENWLRFQKDMANRWVTGVEGLGSDQVQAYRLYTLALAGEPEMGAMNRLRLQADLSLQARWQLAAAYLLSGQEDAARKLVDNAPTEVQGTYVNYYTYGDPLRDKAIIISVLARLNRRDAAAFMVTELANEFSSARWLSTQTTAFGLIALADFYKGESQESGIKASFTDDGAGEVRVNINSLISTHTLSIPARSDSKKVRIINQGENILFARVIHSGIPEAGQEEAQKQNLDMQMKFVNLSGAEIDISNLKQGTTFIAEVSLANPGMRGDYKEMALTMIFPSGWEILNSRMDASAAALEQDAANHSDIRDDRVYTYFDLRKGEKKTFKVMLTATYEGRFYLPGFNTKAMYDASVYARNKGRWVEVRRE